MITITERGGAAIYPCRFVGGILTALIHREFTVNGPSRPERNPTNVEIGERLKRERQRLGVGQAEFSAKVGVSKTTQFNYEDGQRSPDAAYLAAAHNIGVDTYYVITGRQLATADDFVVIRRYHVAVSAGPGAIAADATDVGGLSFSRQWLAKRGYSPDHLLVVDITGDSMMNRLNDGDQALVNTLETVPKSGRAYVLRQGEELLVKYCQLLPGGILRVSSENTAYPPYDIDLGKSGEVAILGRVVASTHEW